MALSDYLTGDEWDACFYVHFQASQMRQLLNQQPTSLGNSMHLFIDRLLQEGHVFPGLDAQGNKKQQVCNGINAEKVSIFYDTEHKQVVHALLDNGREWLKRHCPDMVLYTDEKWKFLMDVMRRENI